MKDRAGLSGATKHYESDALTESSCKGCTCITINCCSIHAPVTQPCHIKDCYSCADLVILDDEISMAYQHLSSLVQNRNRILKERHEESFIQRCPVEVLSMIFVFVKEVYHAEGKHYIFQLNWFKVPVQRPLLLVSSICKRWREVALKMPLLWTNVVVDIMKPAEWQLWMVKEWTRRSTPLPFNLIAFYAYNNILQDDANILDDCTEVITTLRSLATRWNDLVFRVPWSYCHRLFDGLTEPLSVRSILYCQGGCSEFEDDPVKLLHPVRPQNFHSVSLPLRAIPCQWDKLVHLELARVPIADLLDVVFHAPNLKSCRTAFLTHETSMEQFSIPRHIVSRSITHLDTTGDVLNRLSIPSLESLEYCSSFVDASELPDALMRSCPPLKHLSIRQAYVDLSSCLGILSGITYLYIKHSKRDRNIDILLQDLTNSSPNAAVVFPCLQELVLILPYLPLGSWLLLSRLFRRDAEMDSLCIGSSQPAAAFGRPLSKVSLILWEWEHPASTALDMDKETLLLFLAARKSGMVLDFADGLGGYLLDRMAEHYGIQVT